MRKGKLIFYIIMLILLLGALALILCSKFFTAPQEAYAAEYSGESNGTITDFVVGGVAGGLSHEPDDYYAETVEFSSSRYSSGYVVLELPEMLDRVAYDVEVSLWGNFLGTLTFYWSATPNTDNVVNSYFDSYENNAVNEYFWTNKAFGSKNYRYLVIQFFGGTEAELGQYWCQILRLNIVNQQTTTQVVSYTSKYYNHIKELSDSLYDSSYNEGYVSGLDYAKYGIFADAKVTEAYINSTSWQIPNKTLDLSYMAMGFETMREQVAAQIGSAGVWTIKVKFAAPFLLYENSFFVSKPNVTTIKATFVDGTVLQVSQSSTAAENGLYPLSVTKTTPGGQEIEALQIQFNNTDTEVIISTGDGGQYYAGLEQGYNSGYGEGYFIGKNEGVTAGIEQGYQGGYDRGYSDGVGAAASQITGWELISSSFSSIFEALQVKVFGFFSLGDIIGIVFVFGIVFFIFKLIRG